MPLTEANVGISPDGAEVLVRELQQAERLLSEAAGEVRVALAQAGVTDFAPAELDAISAWCRQQAMEVRRRAAAVDASGINARVANALFADDAGVAEVRRRQLFALLGVGSHGAELRGWLADAFPDLVDRRRQARQAMKALTTERTAAAVEAYVRVPGDAADTGERMSQLKRLERARNQESVATAAELDRFLAELDDAEVRDVAAALLEATAGEDDHERLADMAEALEPLRARLRDQLAEAARLAYMDSPDRPAVDVTALARLYKGLGFEKPQSSNVIAEFAAGLLLGDLDRGESTSLSRTLGQLVSGIFAVGDVRDTGANFFAGRWGDAALSAFGAVPIAGDLAKAGDAVEDTATAARRADGVVDDAHRRADDLTTAFKGTPLETWRTGQPLPNAADAVVDPRKYHDYSMNVDNRQNRNKYKAFETVGYDVSTKETRVAAGRDVDAQVRMYLAGSPPARDPRMAEYGSQLSVDVPVRGPNGRTGTLVTVWQYDHGQQIPKLITNYLKAHS